MNRISESDLKVIINQTQQIFNEDFVKGSNIFITGATGFFGKWLLESFLYLNKKLGLNANICALSRNPEIFLEQFPFYKNENCITWIKGDIRTFEFPKVQFGYIIHAATDADARLNLEHPLLMLDTITEGTRRVLDFARHQTNLKGFLLTSSGAVYGKPPENITHIAECHSYSIDINSPDSAYAEGKRLSELYCAIYSKQFNIPAKIARCFAFVGPYLPLDKHFAIGNFIRNGLKGEDIIIKGNGVPLRSYMYATDLIISLIYVLLKGENGVAYNVGSDITVSIKDLAIEVAKKFPNVSVQVLDQVNSMDRNLNYVPDVNKIRNDLHVPEILSLSESIQRTIQFYKENELYQKYNI